MVQKGELLLFRIKPRVEKQSYKIFQAYTIPARVKGSYYFYTREGEYLAFNRGNYRFVVLTREAFL